MSNTYTCTTIHTSREAQQDGGHSRIPGGQHSRTEDTQQDGGQHSTGRRTAQYRTEDSKVQDGGQPGGLRKENLLLMSLLRKMKHHDADASVCTTHITSIFMHIPIQQCTDQISTLLYIAASRLHSLQYHNLNNSNRTLLNRISCQVMSCWNCTQSVHWTCLKMMLI